MITMKQLRFILAPALLVVLVSAELDIWPKGEVDRIEDTMVLLTCVPSMKDGDLNMKWFDKDDNEITNVDDPTGEEMRMIQHNPDQTLSLVFTKLAMKHEGLYRCTANVDGQFEQAVVTVSVKKEIKFLSPKVQPVINGTNARVWCRTTMSVQDQTVKWYQRGPGGSFINLDTPALRDKFIPNWESNAGEEGNYLLIKDVTLADSMKYTCSLENRKEGTARNYDITVVVTVPPKIMPIYLDPTSPKEGDTLTMTCQADGVPAPTYMFYKGSRALMEQRSTDGKYVIENLKRTDEGTYTCNAYNDGGSQNETLNLDVKIPPTFENTQNVSMMEGQDVILPCISTGDPVPSMYWRRKGSQVDYLSQAMTETDIYVDEETDPVIRDGPTTLYRRTLNLMIPELKPEHAGEYVCRADNQYGVKERTFKIDVLYKPNFDNQEIKTFYGWMGSKTNLSCIANGNPEPMFTWLRNGEELKEENPDYEISVDDSGLPTRAIGYLKPKVSNINVGVMFGDYTCRAFNKYGHTDQVLIFQRAEVPQMATVNVITTKATEMTLRISPPSDDGGQPVFKYVMKYGPSDSSEDPQTRNFTRFPDEESTPVTLDKLTPKTPYSIRVYAVNNVGLGMEKKIVESTKDFSKPDPIDVLSPREGITGNSYELQWDVPMTGGRSISNYVVEYVEALKVDVSGVKWKVVRESQNWKRKIVDGESNTRLTLTGLKKSTYYKAKVSAVNNIGASDPTEFVFHTGVGVGPSGGTDCVRGASVAGMLLVVVVTALLPPPLL